MTTDDPLHNQDATQPPTGKRRPRFTGETAAEAGRKGGRTVAERYGHEHFAEMGRKGGRETAERLGREHFVEAGRKGGERTSETHPHEHYVAMSRMGREVLRAKTPTPPKRLKVDPWTIPCEGCGNPIQTTGRKRFCSLRCTVRMQQRRRRAAERAETPPRSLTDGDLRVLLDAPASATPATLSRQLSLPWQQVYDTLREIRSPDGWVCKVYLRRCRACDQPLSSRDSRQWLHVDCEQEHRRRYVREYHSAGRTAK